jgi:hypothetical protein
MTKKIAKKRALKSNLQPVTLKVFPYKGVIGAAFDIAMVALVMSGAIVMVVSAVMMAGKITITAGK